MIEVNVVLNVYGLGDRHEIARLTIVNDGSGTQSRGNYIVRAYRKNTNYIIREGYVENWPRTQKPAAP